MKKKVAVIGTVFVDCKGFSDNEFNPAGRNLGQVKFFHGGVGRNVAETLGNLAVPVTFVSTVDKSGIGMEVAARLETAHIDTRHLVYTEAQGMGFWLAILDNKGDLAGAISQMPDLTKLQEHLTTNGEAVVAKADAIVLELDLNIHITRQVLTLAKAMGKPVYGIPGNLSVILENIDILGSLESFICNDIEATKLLNAPINRDNPEEIISLLRPFVELHGMESMVITLGSEGSVFYDRAANQGGHQPVFPVKLVDSSGAGDAFFAGTVMGLVTGHSLPEAVTLGSKVASWTIQSPENTCQDLPRRMAEDELFKKSKRKALA